MIPRIITLLLAVLCASFALSCVYVKEEVSAENTAPAVEETTQTETQTDLPEFVSGEHPGDEAQPHPGEALYMANCASCHDQPFYKAPSRMFIGALGPQNHLNVMNEGSMVSQAAHLSQEERIAIAEYLSGKRFADMVEPALPPACDAEHGFDPTLTPVSIGWGVDETNSRFQPAGSGGLTAENVAKLEVKWSFAYPNAYQARSEPIYGGGAIYMGSQDGTVWALDAKTGCLRWRFNATAEVRNGVAISSWSADDSNIDPLIFFGDMLSNTYAVSAKSGELRWKIKGDRHRDATSTGAPKYFKGRLYIPVSSLEVVAASNPAYECCTFRGSIISVDAATGKKIWKSYTIEAEAVENGKNEKGTIVKGPSGAPIWSSPAIDAKRGLVYVATGQNYSTPADGNSDAIIAFNMETGEKVWVAQQTEHDAWNTACFLGFPGIDNANCPKEDGPDYDFGSHPILMHLPNGRDMVVGGQKSGAAMGVDPDSGKTLWKTQVGRGGIQGGVHFGIASEGDTLYVPINDLNFLNDDMRYKFVEPAKPGIYAVDADNGDMQWSMLAAEDACGDTQFCDRGVSAAVTAIPGAVIVPYLDGHVRIHSRKDGTVLWDKSLLGKYKTVSGEVATGGAFSGGGVLVAHGLMYVNAGYGFNGHIPGNALVVFGLAE